MDCFGYPVFSEFSTLKVFDICYTKSRGEEISLLLLFKWAIYKRVDLKKLFFSILSFLVRVKSSAVKLLFFVKSYFVRPSAQTVVANRIIVNEKLHLNTAFPLQVTIAHNLLLTKAASVNSLDVLALLLTSLWFPIHKGLEFEIHWIKPLPKHLVNNLSRLLFRLL